MKLSIIVPVYNIENYIDKCLNSLVKQTMKDFEVIVVNDGSPDNSEKIIKKYEEKYPKIIKYYKKKNGGLSSARNYGIKKARGEYICFLDGDDYVEKTTYKKMYDKISKNNLDMVICDLNYVYDEKCVYFKVSDEEKVNNKRLFLTNFYPVAWNKIFKTEVIKKFEFKSGVWFEDIEFNQKLMPFINKIGYIEEALINYVQRDGSITYRFNNKVWDYLTNFEGIIDFYKENNIYDEYKEELEYSYVRYIYGTFIKQAVRSKDLKIIKKAYVDAVSERKKHFPNYRKNKYFKKNGLFGIYLMTFNKLYIYMLYIKAKLID